MGNVSDKETYNYLRAVASDMHVVKGDYDEVRFLFRHLPPTHHSSPFNRITRTLTHKTSFQTTSPLSVTVKHNQIRIGLVHGHQSVPWGDLDALSGVARTLDVDVLISGHTHK